MAKTSSGKFWGKVVDVEEAIALSEEGMAASLIVAVLTACLAFASLLGFNFIESVDGFSLVGAAFYGVLAWGIKRKSRACAVLALVMYILDRAYGIYVSPNSISLVAIVFVTFFINGVRGTFANHKFIKQSAKVIPENA